MQWTTELDDDWDDVPTDPPAVERAELEMNWVENGFVLGPETGDGSVPKEWAVFSTVACKVENDTAEREQPGGAEPTGSAESAEL